MARTQKRIPGPTMRRIDRAALREHVHTPLFQNGYALIASAFSTSGLGIVYWALAARFYLTDDVGWNSAAISSMMLFSGIAQLNLMGALIRFVPTAGGSTGRLVLYSYLANLVVGAFVGLILFLGQSIWTPVPRLFDNSASFFLWFAVSTVIWGIFALQDAVLTGLRQAIWVPIENVIFALIKIVLLVALAKPLPLYGIFVSWTLPTIAAIVVVNGLIFLGLIPRHVQASPEDAQPLRMRPLVRYVGSNYVGFLFFLATTTMAPVMTEHIKGADAAAYVYLAWVFAYSLQLISQNMTNSLTVEGSIDHRRLELYSSRVLLHVARLIVPIVALVLVGAPFILQIFGGGYASHGSGVLRLLALAAIPNIVNVLYVGIARVQQRNTAIIVVQAAQCILCLGLSFVLLNAYGIIGVGVAWVVGQSLVAAVLLLTELRSLLVPGLLRLAGRTA